MQITCERPDIEIAGLRIWIHGRQFPNSQDYWDGNWLHVTVHCSAKGADVRCDGNIIHLSEVAHLLSGIETLYRDLQGKAELPCMEPELWIEIMAMSLGQMEMVVKITPDNLSQKHEYLFHIDQSHLPGLISDCQSILRKYPLRGDR